MSHGVDGLPLPSSRADNRRRVHSPAAARLIEGAMVAARIRICEQEASTGPSEIAETLSYLRGLRDAFVSCDRFDIADDAQNVIASLIQLSTPSETPSDGALIGVSDRVQRVLDTISHRTPMARAAPAVDAADAEGHHSAER
jgi:hypothetical protein